MVYDNKSFLLSARLSGLAALFVLAGLVLADGNVFSDPRVRPIRVAKGPAAVQVWVGNLENNVIPVQLQIQALDRGICFDEVMVAGLGNGKVRFNYSYFRTSKESLSVTPESPVDIPPAKTGFSFALLPHASMMLPTKRVANFTWILDTRQELKVKLRSSGSGRSGQACAPPPDTYSFVLRDAQ